MTSLQLTIHLTLHVFCFFACASASHRNRSLISIALPLSSEERMFAQGFVETANDELHGSADAIVEHFGVIADILKPIFDASPKNKRGLLDDSSSRYSLYRIFMERHGWVVKGLAEPSSKSSMFGLRHSFPASLRTLLDERIHNRGSGIMELSLFAATLEYLIDEETVAGVERLYHLKRLPVHGHVTRWQAEGLIDLYMASFIGGFDIFRMSMSDLLRDMESMSQGYHNWPGTQAFFRTMLASHAPADSAVLSFQDVAHVLTIIVDEFVYWNNHQCNEYKDKLMDIEDGQPGRVRLLEFYRSAVRDNGTTFLESLDYLRQLGALDESSDSDPRVLVSNYLEGPNNCVAGSAYYSVCCMDECVDLYSHIERSLGKPAATPTEIIPVVETLNSASQDQCSTLSSVLQQSLHEAADVNGTVLLHGKPFQEWMHLAYPRECVSPRRFGPAHDLTIDEWMQKTRLSPQASWDEINATIKKLEVYEREMLGPREKSFLAHEEASNADSASTATHDLRVESACSLTWTCLFFVMSASVLSWKLHSHVFPDYFRKEIQSASSREAEMKLTELV